MKISLGMFGCIVISLIPSGVFDDDDTNDGGEHFFPQAGQNCHELDSNVVWQDEQCLLCPPCRNLDRSLSLRLKSEFVPEFSNILLPHSLSKYATVAAA